jgi:HSP20 family protein
VDVKDESNQYIVEAELPGFDKQEIKLDYEDGKLVISATKEEEQNEEKSNYIHRERRQCSMQRVIYLKDVDSEQINAKLDQGVLTIEVPKLNQVVNKRQIEIL